MRRRRERARHTANALHGGGWPRASRTLAAVAACVLLGVAPASVRAQTRNLPRDRAGIDLGGDVANVLLDGYTAASVGTLSTAAWRAGSRAAIQGEASGSRFETGHTLLYGAAHGAFDVVQGTWRTTLQGDGGGGSYRGQSASGYGQLSLLTAGVAGGAGRAGTSIALGRATSGRAYATGHAAAGATLIRRAMALSATATLAHARADYADLVGTIVWRSPIVVASGSPGMLLTLDAGIRDGGDDTHPHWGRIEATFPVRSRTTVVASYGVLPADPERALVGVRAASVGLHVALAPSRVGATQPLAAPLGPSVRVTSAGGSDARVVSIHVAEASTVEIMGDFTAWTPVAMTRGANGEWHARFVISPGAHRANMRIDGGAWAPLPGAPGITDDFGGSSSLLVIR